MTYKICSVNDCQSKLYAKSHCSKHYQQVLLRGSVYISIRDKRPAIIQGEIARIPLGPAAKNGYAIVDVENSWVDKYSWHRHHKNYATAKINKKIISLHTLLMNPPKGMVVDHINHDGLDNRFENLRICTMSENARNGLMRRHNSVGYKGVTFNHGKYQSKLWNGKNKLHLGTFTNPIDAAKAYDQKAKELFGEFALLNFPDKVLLRKGI